MTEVAAVVVGPAIFENIRVAETAKWIEFGVDSSEPLISKTQIY